MMKLVAGFFLIGGIGLFVAAFYMRVFVISSDAFDPMRAISVECFGGSSICFLMFSAACGLVFRS